MALPVREEWFEAAEVEPGLHLITEPATHALILSNAWLVRGRDRDLLVDTGNGIAALRPFVDGLRSDPAKPLIAVATHEHQDHAGGLWEFDDRIAHPSDADGIEHPSPLIRGADVWPAVAEAMASAGFPVTDVLLTAVPSPGWDRGRVRAARNDPHTRESTRATGSTWATGRSTSCRCPATRRGASVCGMRTTARCSAATSCTRRTR